MMYALRTTHQTAVTLPRWHNGCGFQELFELDNTTSTIIFVSGLRCLVNSSGSSVRTRQLCSCFVLLDHRH